MRQHLAQTHGIPDRRVTELLELTGLGAVAHRRVGGYSLGMLQRLGIAAALLGDPGTLILDEPVNGLDPDGVLWLRTLVRDLAAQGRTVLISSHLMSEMALTADQLLIIGRGRLLADTTVTELIDRVAVGRVHVRTPDVEPLAALIRARGASAERDGTDALDVTGLDATAIGLLARDHRLALAELTPHRASLEAAYMDLTRDDAEYHSEGAHQ